MINKRKKSYAFFFVFTSKLELSADGSNAAAKDLEGRIDIKSLL